MVAKLVHGYVANTVASSSSKIIDGSKTRASALGDEVVSSSSKIIDGSKTDCYGENLYFKSSSSKIIDGSKTYLRRWSWYR